MSRNSQGGESSGRKGDLTRGLDLHLGPDQHLHPHLREDSGGHQVDQEAHSPVEGEVAVAVATEVKEADGDHLFDPRLVEGQAALGVLHAIDVGQRGIWYEIVRCHIPRDVIDAGSRTT